MSVAATYILGVGDIIVATKAGEDAFAQRGMASRAFAAMLVSTWCRFPERVVGGCQGMGERVATRVGSASCGRACASAGFGVRARASDSKGSEWAGACKRGFQSAGVGDGYEKEG